MGWHGMGWDHCCYPLPERKELSYCTIQAVSGGLQAALSSGQPLALGTKLPRNRNFIATVCNTVVNAK